VGRHRGLLQEPQVRAWWDERSLRSRLSADTYLRHIGLFVERLGLGPAEILALARSDPEALRARLVAYAAEQNRPAVAGGPREARRGRGTIDGAG
jgi:hypothetical protein